VVRGAVASGSSSACVGLHRHSRVCPEYVYVTWTTGYVYVDTTRARVHHARTPLSMPPYRQCESSFWTVISFRETLFEAHQG
jgi:hypothetical protein